jgi:hypothetical protein
MATGGIFKYEIGKALGITAGRDGTGGKMHMLGTDLAVAGLIGMAKRGIGAYQWQTSDATNLLLAALCDAPRPDVPDTVRRIRDLPFLKEPAPMPDTVPDGFAFASPPTFGASLDSLIDDFRRGLFEPYKTDLMHTSAHIYLVNGGARALIRVMGSERVSFYSHRSFGAAIDPLRTLTTQRELTCVIHQAFERSLLERIATELGPLP